jgi:hypothetical protein
MIETFIENNRKLLAFYYWAARIGGWVLLSVSSAAVIGHSIALASRITDWNEFSRYYQHDVPWGMFEYFIPTGLMVLGIAQLIRYLLESEYKPGWVLRNADKLIYAYTAILLGYYCYLCVQSLQSPPTVYDWYGRLIAAIIFSGVKLLVLIGLAQIVKRLLPVIEESRGLV